jgi:hypothetical protein
MSKNLDRPMGRRGTGGVREPDDRLQRRIRNAIGYAGSALLLFLLLRTLVVTPWSSRAREIPYSEFRAKLKAGQVVEAAIGAAGKPNVATIPRPTATKATAVTRAR